jgi:hypothetical protein
MALCTHVNKTNTAMILRIEFPFYAYGRLAHGYETKIYFQEGHSHPTPSEKSQWA